MSASQCGECGDVFDPETGHVCKKYVVGPRYWPDGPTRPSRADVAHAETSREHLWGVWIANVQWESCWLCGNVRRADGNNKPCVGIVGLGPREEK